jgi:diguanylate cyclase (GGDEF)-like protein
MLDLRTVVLISGILALLVLVVMVFVRVSVPRSIRGLGHWALAALLAAVAIFLFGARGQLSDWVTIVGANVLLMAAVLLFYFGSQRFFGLPPGYRFWLPVLAALVPLLYWFGIVEPDFNVRTQLVCAVWISILLANARLIWRHGPDGYATRFTVVVMLVHATVIALRLLATLLPLPHEGLFTPGRVQTLYLTGNALMIFSFSVGLVLLAAERLRGEYEYQATRDALTGAWARRVLLDACEQELARCRRHGRSMALLLLDIDHFKSVNDVHGHAMGDRVLADFVARVSALLRRPDLLGRFGGEEFVLLLPETTQDEAVAVAERILERVAETSEGLPAITVSIGLTTNRADEEQVANLLGRADRALYRAKAEGRNRVEVA